VIAPAQSGAQACQVATLREALVAALPPGPAGGRARRISGRTDSPVALVGD
jgi:hypothetical protein